MAKILQLGYYGKSNKGDDAYPITFPKVFPSHEFEFCNKIRDAKGFDAIFLGGGNVLSENFINQIHDLKIKKFIFSAGITPDDPFHKFDCFDQIYVRDVRSLKMLREKKIPCDFLPDFAFILRGNKQNGAKTLKSIFNDAKADLYEKKVAVVMNSYLLPSHATSAYNFLVFNQVCSFLSKTFDNTNASFIFIPFGTSFPDDRISNGAIYSRCKFWNKNVMVYDNLSVQDTLDLFSAVDVVISSRLHSSIFSTICGKPFIDLTHHSKNRGFLETIKKTEWSIDYWCFDGEKFEYLLNFFLFKKHNHESELLNIAKNANNSIQRFGKRFSHL